MNEVVKRVHDYRGFKIKFVTKDTEWVIYNSADKLVGTTYKTPGEAKEYVDDLLKE